MIFYRLIHNSRSDPTHDFTNADLWKVEPTFSELVAFCRHRDIQFYITSNCDTRLPVVLERLDLARFFTEIITFIQRSSQSYSYSHNKGINGDSGPGMLVLPPSPAPRIAPPALAKPAA